MKVTEEVKLCRIVTEKRPEHTLYRFSEEIPNKTSQEAAFGALYATIQRIRSSGRYSGASFYNHAIIEDGTLYVSGQVAADEDWNVVGDDVETQARQAYENVGAILDEVDSEFSDIVKVRSYLVDIEGDREEYDRVWNDVFDEPPYPCHVMLGVDQLASPEYLVEVEVEVSL